MERTLADEVLTEQIGGFFDASRKTYGSLRIWLDLKDAGVHVGQKRVAGLMRANGWHGVHRRSWKHATKADPNAVPAPDLVDRDFTATAPNQKWVADVTFVPTVQGWLYLAIVLDVFSRIVRLLDTSPPQVGPPRARDVLVCRCRSALSRTGTRRVGADISPRSQRSRRNTTNG